MEKKRNKRVIIDPSFAKIETDNHLSIPCTSFCSVKEQKESVKKKYIDFLRSIIWVVTGKDIKPLVPNFLKYHFEL